MSNFRGGSCGIKIPHQMHQIFNAPGAGAGQSNSTKCTKCTPVDVQQLLLAIDWATLGRSEFDLPATFAGASWHQPTGGVDVEATTAASADVPMPDVTLHTGRSQAAMELELPQMQSQPACQSPGQDVRLQIDLDSLGQDDFDLAGSAPAGHPDSQQGNDDAHHMHQVPAKKKARRSNTIHSHRRPGRGRKTKYP